MSKKQSKVDFNDNIKEIRSLEYPQMSTITTPANLLLVVMKSH